MKKILCIQYLRALAALAVVGSHTFFGFGAEGVDLFFVISGFIMIYVIHGNKRKPISFFADRYFRVAPLYFIFTFLFVLSGFAEVTSLHQVVQVLTFLKYYETSPLLSIGWTLEYELVFYGFCTLAMVVFKNSVEKRVIFILLTLGFGVLAIDFFAYPDKKYGHFAEFGFGIIVYLLYRSNILSGRRFVFGIAGCTLSIACFYLSRSLYEDGQFYLRFIGFGIPATILFISFLSMRECFPNLPLLGFLGDASYAIYISHTTFLGWFFSVVESARGQSVVLDVLSFLMAVGFGCLVHVFLEKPISKTIGYMRRSST